MRAWPRASVAPHDLAGVGGPTAPGGGIGPMGKSQTHSGETAAYQALKEPDTAEPDQAHTIAQGDPAAGSNDRGRLALIQLIEGEIIPRLLLTQRGGGPQHALCLCPEALRWTEDPHTLAIWFLHTSEDAILTSLRSLSESAEGREDVYYRILAAIPSALEAHWERGACSLEAMTRGLVLLDRVLEELHRCERGTARSGSLDS